MANSTQLLRNLIRAMTCSAMLAIPACGGDDYAPPVAPPPPTATATAYILPNAENLGPNAFGDHPVVIYKGERLRWVNLDTVAHDLVADNASLPEFRRTGVLPSGGEQSAIMQTLGTTPFHCTIHPRMVGTLTVQDR